MKGLLVLILLSCYSLSLQPIECNFLKCTDSLVKYIQRENDQCNPGCMTELCNFDRPASSVSNDKTTSPCLNECFQYTKCNLELLGNGKCDAGNI